MATGAGKQHEGEATMAAIVSMQGRINVDNAGEMRQTLADALRSQAANSKLTVDLSGVTYMDTSGVATLMEAMRTARPCVCR